MTRAFFALFAVTLIAAAGCGQRSSRPEETPTATATTEVERPAPPGESPHTIGATAAGEALEARVKTSLMSEAGMDAGGVEVRATADGVVTLRGKVEAAEKQRQIEAAVLEVEGVRSVENGITVGP